MIKNHKFSYEDLFVGTMMILALLLPLNRAATTIPMILLTILWIADFKWIKIKKLITGNKIWWIYLSLFFAYAFGMIYSQNLQNGMNHLKVKLPLLILPLVIGSMDVDLNVKNLHKIFNSLVLGAFLACTLNYSWILYNWLLSNPLSIHYTDLIDLLQMHPTYFALYLNTCIFYIFYRLFLCPEPLPIWLKLFFSILVLYFFITIILLSARMQLLLCILLFNLSLIYTAFLSKKIKWIFLLILGNGFMFLTIWNSDYTKTRLSYLRAYQFEFDQNAKWSGSTVRLAQWSCALSSIKKHPIFGVGTGDAHDELLASYRQNNFTFGLEKKYNAHNQYLQTTLAIGLIGLFILLINFGTSFQLAWKYRSYLFGIILTLVVLNCLVENMLSRQAGVVYFAFFNALLARSLISKREAYSPR